MRLLCSADSIPGSMVVPFVLIRLLSVDLVEVRSLGKHDVLSTLVVQC
jgi:hypothetical protein